MNTDNYYHCSAMLIETITFSIVKMRDDVLTGLTLTVLSTRSKIDIICTRFVPQGDLAYLLLIYYD